MVHAGVANAATCLPSSPSWPNGVPIPLQTGKFAVSYDAVPHDNNMDGVTGFSSVLATGYTDLAVITRFNNSGFIDARNGGLYQAVTSIPYSAGLTYRFRLEVDIPNHTYNVYVTPPGSSERTIGVGFAFRTEQATASSLGYENVFAGAGSHTVCNVKVSSIYDSVVLKDKPVMYLTMASPASGSELDQTGRGNNGTYLGGTPAASSMPNGDKVAVFNGSGEYLTVPSNAALSIPTTKQLTWEAWIRPDVLDFPFTTGSVDKFVAWMGKCQKDVPKTCEWGARMYNKSTDRPNRLSAYVFNLTQGLGSGADWQPSPNVARAAQWLHVVGEYQTLITPTRCSSAYPGSIDIWVNGVKWDFTTHGDTGCMSQYQITPTASTSPLNVATMDRKGWFKGAIGKVAVYNKLLSDNQINAHYFAMTGRQPSGSCGDTCTLP
jgi:hypothetical protein